MPQRTDIKKVLIIGSGPIIIGQACEFDYSGTQACKALKKLGYEIVLVNSNPATIMTDPEMADVTYIEPLNQERLEQIIAKERPDALLPNLGGQSGLNLCAELANAGILEKYNVKVIGVQVDAIERGEDRIEFKKAMNELGIEIANEDGSMKSLDETLKILRESFAVTTEEQKAQRLATLEQQAIADGYGDTLKGLSEEEKYFQLAMYAGQEQIKDMSEAQFKKQAMDKLGIKVTKKTNKAQVAQNLALALGTQAIEGLTQEQQSAAAVEDSGKELAERIRQIVEETGCGKVNIIAHSKGGLDSRAAIAHCGMAPYVATLTTINTPHRGCIFAEYLLGKVPQAARQKIAAAYNATMKKVGDPNPDFLAAVTDLTESACLARNEVTPDAPGVVYESVMSYCKKAQHGKFPLNMTYPIVKHFDGLNDGLVSVESAKWGERFTLLEPQGKRGISHGDVVDLNRENIRGFDVREFYVKLVADLKRRGY